MVDDFLKIIVTFVFKLIFEVIGFYTGEVLLFLLSFGRKKIRWDFYAEEKPSKFVYLTEASVWIGGIFWICIILFSHSFFFK